MAPPNLETVPARRVGTLLAEARVSRSRSLDDVAARTPFEPAELGRVEAGQRALSPEELDAVCAAYGTSPDALVPGRSRVSVDLDSGELVVAGAIAKLTREPTADDVLAAYLSLVYSLRRSRPGTPLVLREFDLAVLARGLDLARPDVDRRLRALMVEPATEPVIVGRRRSRRRLVIVMGAAVAVLVMAAVVLGAWAGRSDDPAPVIPTASSTVPPASLIEPANVTNDAPPG